MNELSSISRRTNSHRLLMASATRSSLRQDPRNSILAAPVYSAKRKSLILTPASSAKRRQSLPSSQTPQTNLLGPNLLSPAHHATDPRPLRDKNYLSLIQQEVFDFLVSNKFEIELGGHPLTQRTLRQPTQRDFVVVFQFLYHRLDPNYRFTKSIDTEVFFLMRMLGYPYIDTINRTQIASVNTPNWPSILGLLYWLVKLNLSLADFDGTVSDDLIDDPLDQIFIDYIRQLYKAFINNLDDYLEYLQIMQNRFDIMTQDLNREIDDIVASNLILESKLTNLQQEAAIYEQAELKLKALESDFETFKDYIVKMEQRREKWSGTLAKIRSEITIFEQNLQEVEKDKQKCEQELQNQGITPKEIDSLYIERDKLTKLIDLASVRLLELESQLEQREYESSKAFESLDNFVKLYNAMVYRIGVAATSTVRDLSTSTTTNLGGGSNDNRGRRTSLTNSASMFEISLIASFPALKPLVPSQIIDKTLSNEKLQWLHLRLQINTSIHKYQDDLIKVQEQLDLLQEQITEKRDEIETLEAKLSASRTAYDEIYETMTNDTTTYSMQIEKLERELRLIRINTNQGLIEVENRKQEVEIEFEELRHRIQAERSELHDQVLKLIDFTIQFKINVQQNLEDLETLVLEEDGS